MNTKILISFSFSMVSFFQFIPSIHAQVIEKRVILYNTLPVLAEIKDSAEVVKIIKTLPGYMAGYKLEAQKFDESKIPLKEQVNLASGYSVISSDYYILSFRQGFAVLDDETVNQLDAVILHLIEHPRKNLLLSVYNENMKELLYKNRINAIKTYLKVEGISLERIQLNYLDGTSDPDNFRINYIE